MQFSAEGELSIYSQSDTSVTLRFYCRGSGIATSEVTVTVTDANGKTIVAQASAILNYKVDTAGEPL